MRFPPGVLHSFTHSPFEYVYCEALVEMVKGVTACGRGSEVNRIRQCSLDIVVENGQRAHTRCDNCDE
ncbi:hypothetical protein SBA3_2940011 [Candidatus Sulfopaludibacter sp. SbA3]|nr:hypothetical protein SBA3_2940011 [Candidatus Sulfopaludibacter sp. SbA3]